MLPGLNGDSHLGVLSNPAGITIDAEGRLLVSAMGSSPIETPKGALFLLVLDGDLTSPLASWNGYLAFSNVLFIPTAVPEPGATMFLLLSCLGAVARTQNMQVKKILLPFNSSKGYPM